MKCPFCNKEMFTVIKEIDYEPLIVWRCDCKEFNKDKKPTKEKPKKKQKKPREIKVLRELTIDD